MSANDPFDLQRFVDAQAPMFGTILGELTVGRKRTHWMWFVFPQLRALGHSSVARFYGIASADEARAYLGHAELGANIVRCTACVLAVEGRTLAEIFGSPDDLKFRSSMTLFAFVAGRPDSIFGEALERFCDGQMDPRTLALLDARGTGL